MSIDDDISEFFDEDDFAKSAFYTSLAGVVTPISVIVIHGVELVSQSDADLSEVRTVISLQASQVPAPRRDEIIEIEASGVTYAVDRKISDDGSLIEVSVY